MMKLYQNRWISLHRIVRRTLVAAVVPSVVEPGPVAKTRSSNKKPTISQAVYDHFHTSKSFVAHYNNLSVCLFRRRSAVPFSMYCLSEDVADTVFSYVKNHLSPQIPMIELHPGLGLLTRRLLTLDPRKILAYENDPYFKSVMDSIASENSVLSVTKKNFLHAWKEDYKDKLLGGNRLSEFLVGLEEKPWNSEPTVQIIGVAANPKFFQYLVNSVIFQRGITSYGRPEMYLVVPPEIFWQINCRSLKIPPRYSKYILFNLFFDYELICEIEGKSFLPWFRRGVHKTVFIRNCGIDRDNFCLMKAVAKKHLLDVVHPDLLRHLWFFVYQGTSSTKNKVVPYLEKWVPGCGPIFIAKGLSIFTDFRDLTYEEILDVFLTFVNLPEFEKCSFHAAMDSYLYKNEEALDDAVAALRL